MNAGGKCEIYTSDKSHGSTSPRNTISSPRGESDVATTPLELLELAEVDDILNSLKY